RGDRVHRRRRVLLGPRWPDSTDHDATCSATCGRFTRGPGAPVGGTGCGDCGEGAPIVTITEARHRHSPLVRRLARESGLDLDRLVGSGPAGRVTRTDIGRAAAGGDSSEEQPAAWVGAGEEAGDRSTVMPRSAVSVVEVDMSRIVSAADRSDARVGQTSALTAIFVEAGLSGLRGYPALHALFRGGDGGGYRHVAVAVETDDGNVTAVVKNASDLNLGGLTRRIGDLEAHAKA